MSCKYILFDAETKLSKEFTYEELVKLYNDGNYRNISDIIYDRGTKLDAMISELLKLNKECKISMSEDKANNDPEYNDSSKYTPLTLINSGLFRINGLRIIPELNDENFVLNAAISFVEEQGTTWDNATELQRSNAIYKAQSIRDNWQTINEDSKLIHSVLNTFNFTSLDRYDFITKFKGTKFENFASSLYDSITKKGGLLHIIRGSNKLSNERTVKILLNINLSAKLATTGDSILGHYDNLVIDTDGTLHIYMYKVTSTPVSEWGAVKMRNYKYQLALLKLILAYNGFNVSNTLLHLIPIRINYSEDFSKVNNLILYEREAYNHIPLGLSFEEFERASKYFIKSNISLDPIKSSTVLRINNNLRCFFPLANINVSGILKSIDDWILHEYTSKWLGRIKKVNAPDHAYEVFFDDLYSDPIKITSPDPPLENSELRLAVQEHLSKTLEDTNKFISGIVKDIRSSKRSGSSMLGFGKGLNRNLLIALSYIGRNLALYIKSYKEVQGVKVFDWDLISNDTLLNANILVFRKYPTDQIDVVCLSNYSLNLEMDFNNQKNIMGSYIKDSSSDAYGLINYHSSFANIEAMRTMTILNEVLPQIIQSKLLLGELRVISTFGTGQEMKYSMEELNRDLFLRSVRVVKSNNSDFDFVNNFVKALYVDPIDTLLNDYLKIMSTYPLSNAESLDLLDLGINNLESLKTREAKKMELLAIILRIYKMDSSIEIMSPEDIIQSAHNDTDKERRILANLYILCLNAYCYYSGILVRNEYKISVISEYVMPLNRVPNKTYLGVTNMFYKTIDDIAYRVKLSYGHIRNFTEDFYNAMGYGHLRASVVGDLAKAFRNLYEQDDSGNIIMLFRNPYVTDSFPPLSPAERKYLKLVLFEFAKIRSKIYGFDFNFKGYDDPGLINFIEKALNKRWYFNPPLEKASKATRASNGVTNILLDWADKAKNIIKNPGQVIDEVINGLGTPLESEIMERSFNTLHLTNSFIAGDGYSDSTYGKNSRAEMLNSNPTGFFETNVENLLAHYLERLVLVEEFNKTLIAVKGILLQLKLLGLTAGEENKAGIILTTKMITDFTKQNMFNKSIMEPESLKVMAWLYPFRLLVSKTYIAGNIVSLFRDVFEGMWLNTARAITKYLTDIDVKDLTKAYKKVVLASFTSVRGITIIDELCKTYRLSNLDIARISEGLTTSSSGILNTDKWMYYTLRSPDFLNRMVLFVAKCMKDGCWEAFDLKDGNLVYNWRKDKRYSVYADKSKLGTKEYELLRIAYYTAVRQYNLDHPDNTILFTDDLPVAYSNSQIQLIRLLANSIYGAYDKSMKAKYEWGALGITFTAFSTWMNGMVSNYFTKPGEYAGGPTMTVLDSDGSGNLLFFDKNGIECVEIIENGIKSYYYTETGEKVLDLTGLAPIMKDVPRVVLGVWYTICDSISALREGTFKKDIWENPMLLANLRKLITDILASFLFFAIFKLAITPMYKEFKKEDLGYSVVGSGIAEILYKSSSNSYDGFKGPVSIIQFLGENTNPPVYKAPVKIATDLGKFVFGDKTFGQLVTGNVPLLRAVLETYKGIEKQYLEDDIL